MSLIRIEHLRKAYPNVTPLEDVCAEINTGDVIAVIGPSGTGKSTSPACGEGWAWCSSPSTFSTT